MTSEPAGDPRRAAIDAARARRIVGRATVRQLASYAAIAVVALVGPGLIAISQRPDNAAEGIVAVAAGVAVLAWLARRAVTTGFTIDADGLHLPRPGHGRHVPRAALTGLVFTSWTVRGGLSAEEIRLHHLSALCADGTTVRLTTHPLRDGDRARMEDALRDRDLGFGQA